MCAVFHTFGFNISTIIAIGAWRIRSLMTVLTICIVSVLTAAAQDSGIIYCGNHASPKFTVPVRLEPGRGLIVENATCGQEISVLTTEQGYAKVKSWYSTGFVSLEFVRVAEKPLKPAIPVDRTLIECEDSVEVPVYRDIQATSVITNLTCSQAVSFIDMDHEFVRIQIGNQIGYVAAKFIKIERRNVDSPAIPEVQPVIPSPSDPPIVKVTPSQAERQSQPAGEAKLLFAQDPSKPTLGQTGYLTDAQVIAAIERGLHGKSHAIGLTLNDVQTALLSHIACKTCGTSGYTIRVFTAESWIELQAARARSEMLPFSIENVSDEMRLPYLHVLALPSTADYITGAGLSMASSVHRVVLSNTARTDTLQPLKSTHDSVQSNSAFRSFDYKSAGAIFKIEDVERLRQMDKNREFFVVVVGDNQNKFFKVKAKFFKKLFAKE